MTVRKRGDFWSCQFRIDGEYHRYTFNGKKGQPLAKTKTEAKRLEEDLKHSIRNDTFITNPMFSKFFDEVYMPYSLKYKASSHDDRIRGKKLKQAFGKKRLNQITRRMIEKFLEDLLETKTKRGKNFSPVTVRKYYSFINSIFKMAIQEKATKENPCLHVSKTVLKKLPIWTKRDRWLNKYEPVEVEDEAGNKKYMTEEERLFAQFKGQSAHMIPICHFFLETGLRASELLGLKKKHVNLSDKPMYFKVDGIEQIVYPGEFLVERSKSGEARTIPLSPKAREIASVMIEDASNTSEFVFVNPKTKTRMKRIDASFSSACVNAGIEDLTIHDLRRTFATRLEERGVSETTIMRLLGHKSTRTTTGYAYSTSAAKREAVDALANPPKIQSECVKIVSKQVEVTKLKAVNE